MRTPSRSVTQPLRRRWRSVIYEQGYETPNALVANSFWNGGGGVKVVAYVRVSTAKQQEAYGPDVQKTAIRLWAKANGHKVVDWQEDAISGASELHDRAGWRNAATMVKDGRAEGIVVARLDRLARDVMVQELLLRKLSELGGIVLSTRDSENEMLNGESKDPSRKLVRVILGAISEYDREMTVGRLAAARQAKAARGGYAHGPLPYGWRSVDGVLAPEPSEQKALRLMESLAAQGKSTRQIAAALAEASIPTKRGGQWHYSTVARIIKRHNQKATA
jgi:DNA invertase Pin-like site-specific DNA recombinase